MLGWWFWTLLYVAGAGATFRLVYQQGITKRARERLACSDCAEYLKWAERSTKPVPQVMCRRHEDAIDESYSVLMWLIVLVWPLAASVFAGYHAAKFGFRGIRKVMFPRGVAHVSKAALEWDLAVRTALLQRDIWKMDLEASKILRSSDISQATLALPSGTIEAVLIDDSDNDDPAAREMRRAMRELERKLDLLSKYRVSVPARKA